MFEGKASRKVPGGKLVRIKLTFSDKIESAQITGDFFLHPEDSLLKIEEAIKGNPVSISESDLESKIQTSINQNQVQLVGFTIHDLAQITLEALKPKEIGVA